MTEPTHLQMNLTVALAPRYFNGRILEHLEQEIRKTYINRVHQNIIIQDLTLGDTLQASTVDNLGNITVSVTVRRYLQYKVNDILQGVVDLSEPQPLFRAPHVKMVINGVLRQANKILTPYGSLLKDGDTCHASIDILNLINGTQFFQGTVNLIDPAKEVSVAAQ